MIGKIVSEPSVDKVPRGSGNAYFCNVEFGESDIRPAIFMSGAGIDTAPCKGDIATCYYIGSDLFIKNIQSIEPAAKSGERHIYIRNKDREVISEIHFTEDGAMDIKIGDKTTLNFTKDGTAELNIDKNKIEFTSSSIILNGSLEVLQ